MRLRPRPAIFRPGRDAILYRRQSSAPPFNPADLFGGADRGTLLDIQREDLVFRDEAGTVAAVIAGPAGLVRRVAGTADGKQTTSTMRPTYGRVPKGGRRNLLTYTEALSNAAWIKQNSAVSGMRLSDTTSNTSHLLRRDMSGFLAGNFNVSFEFRPFGNVRAFTILAFLMGGGAGSHRVNALTGEVQAGATVVPTSIAVTPQPDGWFRLSMPINYVTDPSYWDIRMSNVWPIPGTTGATYVGDGASGLDLRKIQMEDGVIDTPYQRVVTAFDVVEDGVPNVKYLADTAADVALLALLTAGTYTRAHVTSTGTVTIEEGLAPTGNQDVLLSPTVGEVILISRALTSTEKTRLTEYWEGRYK